MSPEGEDQPGQDDELPRQGFWATMPKRTLTRVLVLLAALAGIIYLRQHTGSISGCMADAFVGPQPGQGVRVRARLLPPLPPAEKQP